MNEAITQMSQELARDITEEVKLINARLVSGTLTEQQIMGQVKAKKELNKERIKALGMVLIKGGKYEERT